jgi:acetolactate synthase I/II/III large subunit
MGLGSFPPNHVLYLGMLGMHAAPSTNKILDEADLLLVLGAGFDDRDVGMAKEFCPRASIIHIDIDEAEIHKIKRADLSIKADARRAIEGVIPLVNLDERPQWMERVSQLQSLFPRPSKPSCGNIHPTEIIRTIQSVAPSDVIVCTDVGQHQMWVAQAFRFTEPRTLLTSGGLGTMGFGLPAAIGAALAHHQRRVLCISGDGSLQMNIRELATLTELGLPVTILVMNNGHLGLVRQQQELFYEQNYVASKFDIDLDFAAIARQYGILSYRAGHSGSLRETLTEAFSKPGPSAVDISVHYGENVLPMVPHGASNRDMIGSESVHRETNAKNGPDEMRGETALTRVR